MSHGCCGPAENDEAEACLSWIFVYCLAGQAAIKSPLSAVRLKCKEVDAAAHFAALSRGANALPPPQPGVSAGVPACHGSCCGVKHASLPFIRLCLCGSELSILPLTVCSCRHLLLCRHQALAHGHKLPELQRSGLARLAHIHAQAHAVAANCACTFREGRGAPVPRLSPL